MFYELKPSNPLEILETNISDFMEYRGGTLMRTHHSNLRTRFGGQLEDGGEVYLNGWNKVSDIIFVGDLPYFFIPDLNSDHCAVGVPVVVRLDILRRQRISAMHTAIHLLCALSGKEMAVGHAGIMKSRIDFLGDAEEFNSRLLTIKSRFDDCIHSNLSVTAIYLQRDKALQFKNVQELKMSNDIQSLRVISIAGVDLRACNGSHVDSTGMLHGISFGHAENVAPGKFKVNLLATSDKLTNLA